MTTFKVGSLREFHSLFQKHQSDRQKRITRTALRRTARRGVGVVKRKVPVAFGELRESVEAQPLEPGGARIAVEAPHAEAVELGSRPHWVPLEALIKWVRLRGMQGLGSARQLRRLPGTSTARQARSIAEQLRNRMLTDTSGDAVAADAAVQVAKEIQIAIANCGTKPQFFVQQAQWDVYEILDEEIKRVLPDSSSD